MSDRPAIHGFDALDAIGVGIVWLAAPRSLDLHLPTRADPADDPPRPQFGFGVIRSWVDGGVQIPVTSRTGLYDRCSTHDLHDHTRTRGPSLVSPFYFPSHGAGTHPTKSLC